MTPIFDTTRAAALAERSAVAERNRRRQWIFFGTLLLACAVSLAFVYLRPAQYQATARWQFVFPERVQPPGASQRLQEVDPAFLTQLQVITSRPLLESLRDELQARAIALPPVEGDTVDALQRSLLTNPLGGTTIVEVTAKGPLPGPLAPTVNTLFEIYQRQLDAGHRSRTSEAWEQARDEAIALQDKVEQTRRELDSFRARHNIVSLERDENQVLAQLKGQAASLNLASEKLVDAEAKLNSLRAAMAAGKGVARARDDPTLASLEQRQTEAREELRLMERKFTEAYMNLDPDAKAMRARLANLEEQIRQARRSTQQSALDEAESEVASARAAADRTARDLSGSRQNVQQFTARLAEYKTMREELDQLEAQRAAAVARATDLEMGSRRAAPVVSLLEPASTPQRPAWPDYTRDAGAAVAGSLLLALLAVGLMELLNRAEPSPTLVMMERGWGPLGPPQDARPLAFDTSARALRGSPMEPPMLEATPLPRELDEDEVAALLDGAGPSARLLLIALLSGLTADEAAALNWSQVDLSVPAIRLADRTVHLARPLVAMIPEFSADPGRPSDMPVFVGTDGQRQSAADIDAEVVFASHDAGLPHPGEINAATLRHTCVAHLVRQGARFGDLSRWVGRLPSDALGIYARVAPMGPKRPAEDIDPVYPALRRSYA